LINVHTAFFASQHVASASWGRLPSIARTGGIVSSLYVSRIFFD